MFWIHRQSFFLFIERLTFKKLLIIQFNNSKNQLPSTCRHIILVLFDLAKEFGKVIQFHFPFHAPHLIPWNYIFFSTSDTEYALKPYTTYLVLKSIDPKKKFAAFHINKTFVTSYVLKPFKSDHIVGVTFSGYFATFRLAFIYRKYIAWCHTIFISFKI